MNLSRRSFVALAAAAVVLPPLTGCAPNQQDVATLVSTLTTAVASLADLQGNSTLAVTLRTDGNAASAAILGWKNGAPAQEAIEAINLVEADLNLIPITPQYQELIALALSTAQFIVSLIPAKTAKVAGLVPFLGDGSESEDKRKKLAATKEAAKSDKEFRKKWNAIIAKHPELQPAAIPPKAPSPNSKWPGTN